MYARRFSTLDANRRTKFWRCLNESERVYNEKKFGRDERYGRELVDGNVQGYEVFEIENKDAFDNKDHSNSPFIHPRHYTNFRQGVGHWSI